MKSRAALLVVLALLAAGGALVPTPQDGFSRPPSAEDEKTEQKRRGTFTIGEDTTYVTGPLHKDGSVDYATALNERLSKGVTPANNANVLIRKALGPPPKGATFFLPPEYFKWLGVPQPPENGDYFIGLGQYVQDSLNIASDKAADEIFAQLGRAGERPWTAAEYPAIASWLKANEKSLAVVIQATKRSHYFSPLTPRRTKKGSPGLLLAAQVPALQTCRALATALADRALLRLAEGDREGAWQDLLACHRLGRLVRRGGTLLETVVANAIDAIASRPSLVWLDRAKPDAKRIEQCLTDLRKLPPLIPFANKMDLTERFMLLDALLRLDQDGLRYLAGLVGGPAKEATPPAKQVLHDIDWDPALRTVNRWCDRLVAALRVKDRAGRETKLGRLDKELQELKVKVADPANLATLLPGSKASAATKGQFLGDLFISLMMSVAAERKVQEGDDRIGQTQDNLTVAFALAWYQRDHGRYPEKLEALAPKYLAKVPQDRFSGKALIYRPAANGYLLCSVGPNGKDEGGRSYNDMPPGDDQSVRMPPPEPRK